MTGELMSIDASAQIDQLTTLCESARATYMLATQQRSRMAAAIVRARATRQILNACMSSPEIVAYLLAMADPEVGMVEVIGNNIENNAKVRVMALALWNGFVPGEQEFAIFKSPTGASLYLKEAGLRKMLIQLGATDVEVNAEVPIQHRIENGPTVWLVGGSASCVYKGEVFHVQWTGKGSVTLPCKMYRDKSGRETDTSDQADGIKTKARRRMLQELYRRVAAVAGVVVEDEADDEAGGNGEVTVTSAGKAALPQPKPAATPLETLTDRATTLANQVNAESGEALLRHHEAMQAATSNSELNDAWKKFETEHATNKYDGRVKGHLQSLGAAMREVLSGQ